ncbi:restriction endonuclease subunit S [Mycoplasma feriruminatoris]|uniref:Type I restriction modification DNA specificity domain-containing protein n=1 Tax=Mycoplasma feriruminatoris TaxID=1179777 RepID=A0AAQ3DNW1_9MOLU|nr:restriction endonuclease subunit S [Mycoplasma feriruminatoris]WFQ95498.1 hypothetical protein MFERI15407_00759 [Mycoplasma feriruminatoris]
MREIKFGNFKYPVYSSQTSDEGLIGYYTKYMTDNAITWTTDGVKAGTVFYRNHRFFATSHCGLLTKKQFEASQYFSIIISRNTSKYVTWVAMPMLTTSQMEKIAIICSLDQKEQSKISSLFSNLDSLITLHQWECNFWNLKKFEIKIHRFFTRFCKKFKKYTHTWEQEKLGNLIRSVNINMCEVAFPTGKFEVIQQGSEPILGYVSNVKQLPYFDYDSVILFGDHTLSLYKPKKPFFVASDGVKAYIPTYLNSYYLYYLIQKNMPSSNGYKRHSSILKAKDILLSSNILEQKKLIFLFSNLDSLITLHQWECNFWNLKKFEIKIHRFFTRFCKKSKKYTHTWEQWKVKDIFEITRGYVVSKKEILETKSGEYIYPIYSSQTINDGLLGYYKSYLASNAITWTTDGANAGTVSYRKGRFYATNVCGLLSTKAFTPNLYLAFALSSETYKHVAKVGNPKLMNNTMANIELIITSNLVEQSKISSLFSNLDSLITLHQWECNFWNLKKFEIKIHRFFTRFCKKSKKYTHTWEQWKVKDIFEITRGYVVSKKEILETKSGEYIYPIYSSQTINDGLLGYYKSYLASNAITWTTDGANAGTVSYRKGRFYATNVCGLLSTKAFTPNLYLAFALSSETYKHVAKVGNPKLMNNTMANIELIITSNLVEQSKISSLFSNLDSLITLHQRGYKWRENIWKKMIYCYTNTFKIE